MISNIIFIGLIVSLFISQEVLNFFIMASVLKLIVDLIVAGGKYVDRKLR